MKSYTKPELTDASGERIVTVLAAKAVGMLIGALAAKKVLGDDVKESMLGIESVLAYE